MNNTSLEEAARTATSWSIRKVIDIELDRDNEYILTYKCTACNGTHPNRIARFELDYILSALDCTIEQLQNRLNLNKEWSDTITDTILKDLQ